MNPIQYEEITVQLPDLKVFYKRTERHLTFAELRILLIMLSDPARIIPTGELIHRAKLTTKSALAKYISALRAILDQKYIFSHRGEGYSFTSIKEKNEH